MNITLKHCRQKTFDGTVEKKCRSNTEEKYKDRNPLDIRIDTLISKNTGIILFSGRFNVSGSFEQQFKDLGASLSLSLSLLLVIIYNFPLRLPAEALVYLP